MYFEKKVDLARRKSMIGFLNSHLRYFTMNSWNGVMSYANCVKLHRLGLDRELIDKAYLALDAWDDFSYLIDDAFEAFKISHNGYWSLGFNGRSSGYIVLYGTRFDADKRTYVTTCQGVDEFQDFETWSITDLRERVELIRDFDRTCDLIRDDFINVVRCNTFEEETFYVPQKRIRCVPIQSEQA